MRALPRQAFLLAHRSAARALGLVLPGTVGLKLQHCPPRLRGLPPCAPPHTCVMPCSSTVRGRCRRIKRTRRLGWRSSHGRTVHEPLHMRPRQKREPPMLVSGCPPFPTHNGRRSLCCRPCALWCPPARARAQRLPGQGPQVPCCGCRVAPNACTPMHCVLGNGCQHRGGNGPALASTLAAEGPFVYIAAGDFGWLCGVRADGTARCAGEAAPGADNAWMAGATTINGHWDKGRCRVVNGVGSCIGKFSSADTLRPAILGNVIALSSDSDAVCIISGPEGARPGRPSGSREASACVAAGC